MKKWLLLYILFILAACSDENLSVSSTLPASPEKPEPTMESVVEVYTPNGSVNSYVVKEEKRDKWVLLPASVLSNHPKALIVTSEKQQLEGKVVSYDEAQNIALVHFRNSAVVESLKIAETLELGELATAKIQDDTIVSYASYAKSNEMLQELEASSVKAMIEQATAKGITRKDRQVMRAAFAQFDPLFLLPEDVLATYEKQTFAYNADDVLTFTEQFHAQFEQFLHDGNIEPLKPLIAADSLMSTLVKLQQTTMGKVAFQSLELKDVQLLDHQFHVQGVWTFEEKEKLVEGTITYKLIQREGQFYVNSINLE